MERFVIRLNDLKFYSRIGVMDQERAVGNEFTVDVEIKYPVEQFRPEDLSTTVSYADVYDMVARRMKQSWMLLESVAKVVSDDLHQRYPRIENLAVTIKKTSVPVRNMDGTASITLLS